MILKKHLWILDELKALKDKGLISTPRKRGGKGYANFPIKWSIEGNFKDYALAERGVNNRAFASYNAGKDRGGIVFIDMDARDKGAVVELKKTLEDDGYVKYRKKLTDSYAQELLKFSIEDLSEQSIVHASKKKLWELYNTFKEIYVRYEFYNSIWFTISDELQKLILQRLKTFGITSEENIHIFMTCPHQGFTNKEYIDLLKACIKIKDIDVEFEEFKNDHHFILLTELSQNYYWIPFGHIGPDLYDEKHYYGEIKKLLGSGKDLHAELSNATGFYPSIKRKQAVLIEKYSVDDDTSRLLQDMHLMIQMQDERKELVARTHINWVNNLMRKIGSYMGLGGMEAADVYPQFVEKCLIEGIVDLDQYNKDQSTHRKFKISDAEGHYVYFDEDAEQFLEIIESAFGNDLKGECASPGIVKGRIRVLLTSDEIDRVKKGDILVTTMTTPDFVPAMRNAAGIITDEGGVTCHAAIVSRELGIPCIINTKNATDILRDGEIIEMDAAAGTIKRLDYS